MVGRKRLFGRLITDREQLENLKKKMVCVLSSRYGDAERADVLRELLVALDLTARVRTFDQNIRAIDMHLSASIKHLRIRDMGLEVGTRVRQGTSGRTAEIPNISECGYVTIRFADGDQPKCSSVNPLSVEVLPPR